MHEFSLYLLPFASLFPILVEDFDMFDSQLPSNVSCHVASPSLSFPPAKSTTGGGVVASEIM